jgi:hypothetical protein
MFKLHVGNVLGFSYCEKPTKGSLKYGLSWPCAANIQSGANNEPASNIISVCCQHFFKQHRYRLFLETVQFTMFDNVLYSIRTS